ncbi:kinase-like domain, phloem protein 2-like protein [Tanacetum coccineum]
MIEAKMGRDLCRVMFFFDKDGLEGGSATTTNTLPIFATTISTSILSATNYFADENVIRKGGIGNRYKKRLLWLDELIDFLARRLNISDWEEGEKFFWNEVLMLSSLKHKNVISLVGFSDENDEKIMISRHDATGSLRNYLSDQMRLTWVQRLEICVGLAHALSYIIMMTNVILA